MKKRWCRILRDCGTWHWQTIFFNAFLFCFDKLADLAFYLRRSTFSHGKSTPLFREELINVTTMGNANLNDLAGSVVGCFPTLDLLEQRMSLELYRLLAEGQPVPRATLAERLGIPVDSVNRILDTWPGVFSDPKRQVVGYWGLAIPAAYASPHRFTIDGRSLSAWCAWDTLFLPQLLGQTAQVESIGPTGVTVRLTVTPDRVESVDPIGAQMSFLLPDCTGVLKDVLTTVCHFIQFFPWRQVAESWTAQHAGTFLVSIHEAHVLARLKNEAQYREVLVRPAHPRLP